MSTHPKLRFPRDFTIKTVVSTHPERDMLQHSLSSSKASSSKNRSEAIRGHGELEEVDEEEPSDLGAEAGSGSFRGTPYESKPTRRCTTIFQADWTEKDQSSRKTASSPVGGAASQT